MNEAYELIGYADFYMRNPHIFVPNETKKVPSRHIALYIKHDTQASGLSNPVTPAPHVHRWSQRGFYPVRQVDQAIDD